jgi:hypothetical protein
MESQDPQTPKVNSKTGSFTKEQQGTQCDANWNELRLRAINNPSDVTLRTLLKETCINEKTLNSMTVTDFIQTMKTIPDGIIKNTIVYGFNWLRKEITYEEVSCTGTSCTVYLNNLHNTFVEPVQNVAKSALNLLGFAYVAGKPSSGGNRQKTRMTKNSKNKTRKHQEKVIFVFYTFAQGGSWTYNKLPTGWWWVGGGSTVPVNASGTSGKYEREEQFQGPAKTQDKTMLYLDKVFTKLKQDGVISKFKLRKSFLP